MSIIKKSLADKLITAAIYIILSLIFILVAYPIIFILSSSLSSTDAILSGRVWLLPVNLTLLGYKTVFATKEVWTGYLNSIIYVLTGTTINIIMTIMVAYPLSRKDFKGRGAIMALFTFTMFFSGGMIPTYLTIHKLRMINTIWAMILPGAIAVWNMILARTYFATSIPIEMLEAARLDGCGNTRFILKIVLPLSKPIIAVLCLYYAVGHWNSYFNALLYLNDADKFPLQIILRNILILSQMDDPSQVIDSEELLARIKLQALMKYALIVVASIPVMVAYPFVQKYFVKGVMIGSLKG